MDGRIVAVALLAAVAAGCLARAFVRQPARMAARVQPYTTGHRRTLGTTRPFMAYESAPRRSGVRLVFGPVIHQLANGLASIIDASSSTSRSARLPRQRGAESSSRRCVFTTARLVQQVGQRVPRQLRRPPNPANSFWGALSDQGGDGDGPDQDPTGIDGASPR